MQTFPGVCPDIDLAPAVQDSNGLLVAPRVDRRHRSPRPPPEATRGSSRISGARHVQRAAARPAATTRLGASRARASAGRRVGL